MSLRKDQPAEDAGAMEERLRTKVLKRMIDDELIREELDRRGVRVDDDAILASVAQWRGRFRTESEFQAYVDDRYGGLPAFHAEVRRSALRARFLELASPSPTIDEATVRKYYDEHVEEFAAKVSIPLAPVVRPFADAAPEIRDSLARREQYAAWAAVLQHLRDSARIERLASPALASMEVQS
jgi:peptidyl-prolyl cis-trans isomerase C